MKTKNTPVARITRWNLTVGGVYGVYGETYRVEVLRTTNLKETRIEVRRRDTGETFEMYAFDCK